MTARTLSLATATAAAAATMLMPTAAVAANGPACDAYSRHCPDVEPSHITRPPTEVKGEKETLPFTGAELVLLVVVGGGAVGAGTAFVVAGRRRRHATT